VKPTNEIGYLLLQYPHHGRQTVGETDILRIFDGWKVSLYRDEGCVVIETTDYHPPELRLTAADLWGLLEAVTG
jgi:hypothetical protein